MNAARSQLSHRIRPLLAEGKDGCLAAPTANYHEGDGRQGLDGDATRMQRFAHRYGSLQRASSASSTAADTLAGRPGAAVGASRGHWMGIGWELDGPGQDWTLDGL